MDEELCTYIAQKALVDWLCEHKDKVCVLSIERIHYGWCCIYIHKERLNRSYHSHVIIFYRYTELKTFCF